jgi:hypothetical protein
MSWEPVDDMIYITAYNEITKTGEWRSFDRMTGYTTLIGLMEGKIDGLAFPGGNLHWLSVGAGPIFIAPGDSVQMPVDFDATDLDPGTYTGYITFQSDPDVGTMVIPVTLIVQPRPTLSIADRYNVPAGPVSVPVYAQEITNMGSFQFTIDYDVTKLVYNGTFDWYPGITDVLIGNPSAGKLTFVWAASTAGITIADGNLFNMYFTFNGSLDWATIAWSDDPTPREFADWDGSIFYPVYHNGFVTGPSIGISENGAKTIKVYPNPASNIMTVKSDFGIIGIGVLSSLGQTVVRKYYPGEKEVQFNVSAMPAGIYLVKVYTEKGVGMVKVAVER